MIRWTNDLALKLLLALLLAGGAALGVAALYALLHRNRQDGSHDW